jgi:hypothetical protein
MNKYYATATNSKGVSFIINFTAVQGKAMSRVEATNQAESYCKRNGLTLDSGTVRTFKGINDSSTILTKFAKARKAKRGVKGWKETF